MNQSIQNQSGDNPAQSGSIKNALWVNRSKWGKFGVILIALLIISAIASLATRFALFGNDFQSDYKIALVAPLSGDNKNLGQSLKRGAEVYIEKLNQSGGIEGKFVGLTVHDNKGDAALSSQLASKAVNDENVLAIIGPWSSDAVDATASVIGNTGLAMITPSPQAHNLAEKHNSLFTLTFGEKHETRFLANYMRNVLQEKLVSIVYDSSTNTDNANEFRKAFERFGIELRHNWSFDSTSGNTDKRFAKIAAEIKAASDSGAIYLAMNAADAAKLVTAMRDVKAINNIMGPHLLGTNAFAEGFTAANHDTYADGIMTAAPLMFDTANQKVQNFRSAYLNKFKQSPDWIAAYGFESASIIGEAVRGLIRSGNDTSTSIIRKMISEYLLSSGEKGNGIAGMTGETIFDKDGVMNQPIQVGSYNGRQIISAPTQLQPIGAGEVDNYIQAVREGRALYVNDRFMYKTNVVYSGINIEKISNYNPKDENVELEFVIWFRYRGKFEPQDVVFDNAVEPIVLGTPDREETIGDLNYRRYRVKAKFDTDFLNIERNYGSKLIGTTFRHRLLNKNNLIYVVDVVGVGLTDGGTYQDALDKSKALGPTLGLISDRAWISQEIVRANGLGDPNFVGHGKPAPDFSRLEVGIVAVDGTLSLADIVPNSYLLYLSIFAVFGSIFAMLMDRKKEGRTVFWNLQSWLLRLVCWPLFLASAGSLVLNFAFQNLEFHYVEMLVPIYEALWWVFGAILLSMAIERFIWVPLENRTERKVPGSIRAFSMVVIYLLAAFGIIAFVLHQELTSLLATSGLLAMVIGLAIQANIANVFSGIILNLERPFNVGDIIKVGDETEAEVTDISWRTTRAVDADEKLHCIPNAKATEDNIVRICKSTGETYYISENVYVPTSYSPELVNAAILRAIDSVDGMDRKATKNRVEMKKMMVSHGVPYLAYRVWYTALEYRNRHVVRDAMWRAIPRELEADGIYLNPDLNINNNRVAAE